jgi:hypothetical protein
VCLETPSRAQRNGESAVARDASDLVRVVRPRRARPPPPSPASVAGSRPMRVHSARNVASRSGSTPSAYVGQFQTSGVGERRSEAVSAWDRAPPNVDGRVRSLDRTGKASAQPISPIVATLEVDALRP